MKLLLIWAAKAAAIWVVTIIAAIAGNALFPLPMEAAAGDGPLTAGQAFLLVNGLTALVLSALAPRLNGAAWERAALLFLFVFLLETLLSQIESWFFGQWLALPAGMLPAMTAAGAIKAMAAAGAAALLWRPRARTAPRLSGLAWKLPLVVAAYVLLYFAAGQFIAWQSEAVRAYYEEGLGIDTGRLVLLQVGRGAVWALLAAVAAWRLGGPPLGRALLAGTAFSVLMAAPLLFPNPFMPWSVRSVHLVEIGVSNFLFGLLAVPLLCMGSIDRKIRKDAAMAPA
ncbi:hypothetical protein [Sphingosinicella terrae]|uniref:hypothetical protein n=1 Tax=Sphingosinicella terrae TaxID=2172047 RepID=UPI000E0D8C89|nr:hypothetical protein [Sphingosinicella terrae]